MAMAHAPDDGVNDGAEAAACLEGGDADRGPRSLPFAPPASANATGRCSRTMAGRRQDAARGRRRCGRTAGRRGGETSA